MLVYQTDNLGFYLGPIEADESPLEPGQYLIPAGAVPTAPPKLPPAGKAWRWNGSAWVLANLPKHLEEKSAVEKLTAFLQANQDVLALVLPAAEPDSEGAPV